jgi:hypothetical protein
VGRRRWTEEDKEKAKAGREAYWEKRRKEGFVAKNKPRGRKPNDSVGVSSSLTPQETPAPPPQMDPQTLALLHEKYPVFFLKMNPIQEKFIRIKNDACRTPKRRLAETGNKGGKTEIGVCEDLAHAWGYRPWLKPDDPDYHIDVKVPNHGLVGCETMEHSVPEKLEPVFRKYIPDFCKPQFKLNARGKVQEIRLPIGAEGEKCESVIHLRSYDQNADTFEGIDLDWIHWDEPPPEEKFKAAERGKVVTNAPSWFTMTPLKEAYIYDMLTLNAFNLGGEDQEIAVIRGAIWDNCRDWCRPCNVYIPENVDKRVVNRCPKCQKIMGFMPKAGIDEYLKTLDPEERVSREEGTWHHLSGLVYKELDREKHIYEDFMIPKNWPKVEGVDPHDARPTCWIFGVISPEEIEIQGKKRFRIYWYDHLLVQGSVADMVSQVRGKRAVHGYKDPMFVSLDKKYGEKTQMENKCWQDELEKNGIRNIRLSHSSPGDVELGHKIVRDYLKLQYSALTGAAKPGMLFARNGCGGKKGPVHQMFNYQYKEGQSKPEEEFKDFPDTVRYVAMEAPIFKSLEDDKRLIQQIMERNRKAQEQRRMRAYA